MVQRIKPWSGWGRVGWLLTVSLVLAMISTVPVAADPQTEVSGALRVEGISNHAADDDPGVLYILPWQPPTLPRRPRARLDEGAPDLLELKDPVALERHRVFRETLNPSLDSSLSLQ